MAAAEGATAELLDEALAQLAAAQGLLPPSHAAAPCVERAREALEGARRRAATAQVEARLAQDLLREAARADLIDREANAARVLERQVALFERAGTEGQLAAYQRAGASAQFVANSLAQLHVPGEARSAACEALERQARGAP